MDNGIQIESKISYEDLSKLTWFNILKRGRYIRPLIILFLAILFVLLLAFFIAVLGSEPGSFPLSLLVYSAILALMISGFWLMINLTIKKTYRTSAQMKSTQRFEFTADTMLVETTGENVSGKSEYKYGAFYRVFEVKDAFYLFINHQQAHLVSKRNMNAAKQDDLAKLLEARLGKRFVQCI